MITYRRDGLVESEVDVRNGLREGRTTEFYKNGEIFRIVVYKNDKVKLERYFDEDGSNSSDFWYDEKGSIIKFKDYKN